MYSSTLTPVATKRASAAFCLKKAACVSAIDDDADADVDDGVAVEEFAPPTAPGGGRGAELVPVQLQLANIALHTLAVDGHACPWDP